MVLSERWKENKISSVQDIPWTEQVPVVVFEKDTGFKAIVNANTKETITIATNVYQPVQHREVYEKMQELSNYKVNTAYLYSQGRRMMIELREAKIVKRELLPGDYFENRIRIFNSYDGTMALSLQSYGIRLVCTNGMVAPTLVSSYRKIHAFQNIDLEQIEKYAALATELWGETKELMRAATQKIVNVNEVLAKFNFLPKKYTKIVQENLDANESVYDIWNELTRTISHDLAPNVGTNNLVETQKYANTIFKLLKPMEVTV